MNKPIVANFVPFFVRFLNTLSYQAKCFKRFFEDFSKREFLRLFIAGPTFENALPQPLLKNWQVINGMCTFWHGDPRIILIPRPNPPIRRFLWIELINFRSSKRPQEFALTVWYLANIPEGGSVQVQFVQQGISLQCKWRIMTFLQTCSKEYISVNMRNFRNKWLLWFQLSRKISRRDKI